MAAHALAAQACGNHRHADVVAQFVVISGTVNDVCICRGIGTNGVHRQLGFAQFERAFGCRHQHQNALGARQINAFKQRTSHRLFSSDACAVGAIGHCGAHHGFAGFTHHGAHVFKVDVDVAVLVDDFGNAADCVFKHVIGMGKGLILCHLITEYFKQFFVQHDNQ